MPDPYSDGSEFDEGEIVVGMLFVSCCDGAEVFEFVEEALDQVALSVEIGAEGGHVLAVRHGLDVGPCAARRQAVA